ncbi:vesicular glutamate transporter 3-like isoform X2 [Planococcus citri]|uniref:vesicular glutamate transporter 3-like isoform X2 n=1 Tax=Planococcus citri TaxID=170843 RepID=UPI0031F89B20
MEVKNTRGLSKFVKKQQENENHEIREVSSDDTPFSTSIWFSRRFWVAVVVFLCFTNVVMLMCSVNIAIVEMTSSKNVTIGNKTVERPPEFAWNSATIGIVSSVFLYGELLSFFSGFFVNKLGGSTSGSLCMLVGGVLTILQPATLYFDYNLFLVNRFVTGCFVVSFFVSTAQIYSQWFPKKERSTLISLCYNGSSVGVTISYPLFGYVAAGWGWQMVFYMAGAISVIFAIVCVIFVKNCPTQDGCISDKELRYILDGTDDLQREQNTSHPYRKILLSAPVLAVCFAKFTLLWIDVIVAGCLPLYVKDLTGESTDQVGLISSIPTAVEILIYPLAGALLDFWKNNTDIKLTRMHKITVSTSYISTGVFFVGLTLSTSFTLSMAFFVLIQIALSVVPPVLEPIIVNVAPNDSSVVAGLALFFGSIGTIIARTLTGFMTIDNTLQEWNNCFLLASAVLVSTVVIFARYGSSEAQSWSSTSSSLPSSTDGERDRLIRE